MTPSSRGMIGAKWRPGHLPEGRHHCTTESLRRVVGTAVVYGNVGLVGSTRGALVGRDPRAVPASPPALHPRSRRPQGGAVVQGCLPAALPPGARSLTIAQGAPLRLLQPRARRTTRGMWHHPRPNVRHIARSTAPGVRAGGTRAPRAGSPYRDPRDRGPWARDHHRAATPAQCASRDRAQHDRSSNGS
jgi:hypothetical protein